MEVGNIFASLVLGLWPLACWILFTRLDVARALIWSVLASYMFLPPLVSFDLPMVPGMTKDTLPAVCALVAVLTLVKDRPSFWPQSPVTKLLMVVFLLSPCCTVLANGDPVAVVGQVLPGLRTYDSVAALVAQALVLIPFVLGRHYLGNPQGMEALCKALVLAGLIYSVPMLYESRMSPQLNVMIYGFFQHDFAQAIRFGGFRPFVFMPHGLWVGFFTFMCVAAAALRYRQAIKAQKGKALMVLLYLVMMLVLCRSAGPVIYGVVIVPLVLFLPLRIQVLVAVVMTAIVIGYPLLRGLQLIPVEALIKQSLLMDQDRGLSLQFRLLNEELLLNHAAMRPWFGWGGYGRNFLYDPLSGEINVIADGGWIIALGTFGWLGYLSKFGLMSLSIFALWRAARGQKAQALTPAACAVALILAANLFDLLPNDTQIPFTWLMSGAVLGYAEGLRHARPALSGVVDASETLVPKSRRTVI